MLLLALSLAALLQEPVSFEPLSSDQFAIARLESHQTQRFSLSEAQDQDFLRAALARRGHSGDMTFLQGCDLTDPAADVAALNADLVRASSDWDAYQTAVQAGRIGVVQIDLPTSEVRAADVQAAKRADQAARQALSAPHPNGELGEVVVQLRLFSMCEVDVETGRWMQQDSVRSLFSETSDAQSIGTLVTLALHLDHLPHLQADYAEVYIRRHADLALPVEPGLRLKDRSLVNLGLPQRYATLILCEDGKPTFAGKVDLSAANRLREEAGLPPEDLEAREANGYCG